MQRERRSRARLDSRVSRAPGDQGPDASGAPPRSPSRRLPVSPRYRRGRAPLATCRSPGRPRSTERALDPPRPSGHGRSPGRAAPHPVRWARQLPSGPSRRACLRTHESAPLPPQARGQVARACPTGRTGSRRRSPREAAGYRARSREPPERPRPARPPPRAAAANTPGSFPAPSQDSHAVESAAGTPASTPSSVDPSGVSHTSHTGSPSQKCTRRSLAESRIPAHPPTASRYQRDTGNTHGVDQRRRNGQPTGRRGPPA